MRKKWVGGLGLALGMWALEAQADDVIWRPVMARTATAALAAIPLLRLQRLDVGCQVEEPQFDVVTAVSAGVLQ